MGRGQSPLLQTPFLLPLPKPWLPGAEVKGRQSGQWCGQEVCCLNIPFPHQHILLHSQVWLLKTWELGTWGRGLFGFDLSLPLFFFSLSHPTPHYVMTSCKWNTISFITQRRILAPATQTLWSLFLMRVCAGVQVAGGDLGVQTGEARVPLFQPPLPPQPICFTGTFSSFSHRKGRKMLFLDTFYE